MSLYGDSYVRLPELKIWAANIDIDNVVKKIPQIKPWGNYASLKLCRDLLDGFKKMVADLKDGDDWRDCQQLLNNALMPALFMVSDNAIRVANYYECLVTYADVATKKKLVKGFQYKDVGEVNIYEGDKPIGCIGYKSDLIWHCLYGTFIHIGVDMGVEHTLPDHEEIFGLQLDNTFGLTDEEVNSMVDEVLFKCSVEYGLNFKRTHLDPHITEEGVLGHYELRTTLGMYDTVPMMYYNSALAVEDVRIKYLNFYQVAEYYYNRAQNHNLIDAIIAGNYISTANIDHRSLKKTLKDYIATTSERESLRLVLKKAVNVTDLQTWIQSCPDFEYRYCHSGNAKIDLDFTKPEDKTLGKLMERLYSYRCSIAHAKGDIDEYIALPESSNDEISKELPLIRYVAEQVIKNCAKW